MQREYDITIYAPLGVRYGTMVFDCVDCNVTGTLNAFGNEDSFSGTINGSGEVELSGKISSLLNTVSFHANGVIGDCSLRLQLFTKKHSFIITGTAQEEGEV